jgi:hypothetical protein
MNETQTVREMNVTARHAELYVRAVGDPGSDNALITIHGGQVCPTGTCLAWSSSQAPSWPSSATTSGAMVVLQARLCART